MLYVFVEMLFLFLMRCRGFNPILTAIGRIIKSAVERLFYESLTVSKYNFCGSASWSSGSKFVSGTEGLRFKSWADQIGHSVANGSQLLQHLKKKRVSIAQ